jgi:deazaflavin-dependent oxidoreductase (nitroreductase family)
VRDSSRLGDRGVPLWRLVFATSYRLIRLLDPIIRAAWRTRAPGTRRFIDLELVGRRTRRPRRTLVTALNVDDRIYVGHPNGEAAWVRNLEASGELRVVESGGAGWTARAIRLGPGDERESVIRATGSQQPFPANLVYSAAREHIRRVGAYFRLERAPGP